MAKLSALHSGQSEEQWERDADRDRWFNAEEARDYGLLDRVITSAADITGGGGTGA